MVSTGDVLRLMSCSGAPCKVVVCILQRTMHAPRIFRSQNLLPPGFDGRGRCAAARRCDVERPSEMFSGVTQTDAQAVMATHFIIERADIAELLRKRWRCFDHAGVEATAELARQPRLALRATTDHHGVCARHVERRHSLFE